MEKEPLRPLPGREGEASELARIMRIRKQIVESRQRTVLREMETLKEAQAKYIRAEKDFLACFGIEVAIDHD